MIAERPTRKKRVDWMLENIEQHMAPWLNAEYCVVDAKVSKSIKKEVIVFRVSEKGIMKKISLIAPHAGR
jgi:hypothetical protein